MSSDDFQSRRAAARKEINKLDNIALEKDEKRDGFFDTVYERAEGDGAAVPWADLAPKPQLVDWLAKNPVGDGNKRAADVACGLGDHAEAMAKAGYQTTGFDIARSAIDWAKKRFPQSSVDYRHADLFNLPQGWPGGFDLVYECYTIQAVPPKLHENITRAIASLVAPGGTLLALARTRAEDEQTNGPPWHLAPSEYNLFKDLGFRLESISMYETIRADKSIPHIFAVWQREAGQKNQAVLGSN
jgi:2-polyprenyl-3-methyl-5-hydroxy-6-metoxy-1,4-benzoquinol methylase